MRRIVQFRLYKGEKYYIGECLDLPIVTQGRSIDETVRNIKEALALHLEGENLADFDIAPDYSVLVHFEIEPAYA